MDLNQKVVVVTGGISGVGLALCQRFAEAGAQVVLCDLDVEVSEARAVEVGAVAIAADVSQEAELEWLVATVMNRYGHIDLFCSNAGIRVPGSPESPDGQEQMVWEINVVNDCEAWLAGLRERSQKPLGGPAAPPVP